MSLLVVEDNTISLRMLEVVLQSNGFAVVTAKNGRQALEKLAERDDIQMILTDLMMPEMDGMQLLEEVAKHPRWKLLPVIVLTSLSDADTVRRVVQLGCRNYLVKPLKEELVIPKVRSLLADSVSESRESVLKSKFQVLEQAGLDVEQYEKLFDAFHGQMKDVAAAVSQASPASADDALGRAILGLRDGVAMFSEGRLGPMLEGFRARGNCDMDLFRSLLSESLAAMDLVVGKRNRLREKVGRGEASGE